MRSIAEGHVVRMLAGAPGNRLRLFDLDLLRLETGAGMRAVAKWLTLRASASAPPIGARFDFLHDGPSLKDDGFCHKQVGYLRC